MRLIYKLTLATVIPALLICGVGFYATRQAERSLREAIVETSRSRARTAMAEIDRTVNLRVAGWQAYIQSELVKQTLRESNAEFEEMFADIKDPQDWIDAEDVAWPQDPHEPAGPLLVSLLRNDLSDEMRTHIRALAAEAGYPVIGEAFLTNRYGVIVALTHRTEDYWQEDESWWQMAMKNRVYIGEVKVDLSARVQSMEVCLRVGPRGGEFLGVLKAVLNIDEVAGIIESVAADAAAEGEGDRLILFTSGHKIIRVGDDADAPLEDGSAYFEGVTLDPDNPVFAHETRGPDGVPVLRAFALSEGDGRVARPRWVVMSARSAAEVFAPIEELRKSIWMLAALATLLALAIGGYFALSISRRVQRVSDATVEIAEGRLQTHVPSEGRDELAELAARFNRMSDELTLADEALREAKDEAEAANTAKSLFLANMSHEIRTPLTGVLGVTDLLAMSDLPQEQQDRLGMLRESGQTLRRLIDDMLDFSKIEAGKIELERIPFQLREVVGRGVQSLAPKAAEKQLELACRIEPSVPDDLVGDPGRLQQVLLNLAGNAIKFTDSGEVLIEVHAAPVRAGTVELDFSVRDTGIGIAPESRERIFESFSQADASTTRKYGGTGLGLSISARLVELMRGEISVDAGADADTDTDTKSVKGTTFRFTAQFGVEEGRAQPARPSLRSLEDLAVLVVDDNHTNREILVELLHNWGLAPKTVTGAAQALEELRRAQATNTPYPLVLTDLCMPDMDGFALSEQLRDDATLGYPTVIMLSSGADAGDPERSRQVGVARYLTKPVVQSDLLEAITACMDPDAARQAQPEEAADEWPEAEEPLRILLAEDGLINQHVICGYLAPHGHTVRVVHDGQQVLEALNAEEFDLVLMDLQMPVMDGLEATRRVRAREAEDGGHLPIIALTAAAMEADRERALSAGMDAHVAKPVDSAELFAVISRVVARDDPAGSDAAAGESDPGGADTGEAPQA